MDIIIVNKDLPFEVELAGGGGFIRRVLVHHEGEFYVISENTALKETLIFSASPTGEVTNWNEVGGGGGLTVEEVLKDFEQFLYGYF